ncbi:unnamed protein product [Alternaria alternata]
MASQGMDENYCAKDWCFIESQTWVGSDYVRYDPEICFVENPPEICEDTSFDPDIIDSTLQSVVGLYEPDLYCDECFLKIWRQRLLSPFLTTGDWTQFRIDAFEELQSNCSIHMPYVTSDYSLFVGTPTATPTATSAIHIPPACTFDLASGQYICPTASTSCTGQIVEANPELRGCSAIADEFHVSTGDLRVATGNDFCAFQEQICLPLPCTTIEITKYDETCSDMVKQISNSTHRVTQEQFMGWNPHLMGPCDSMALGQRICVSPPGDYWVSNTTIVSPPSGVPVYYTTATPVWPTQSGSIENCGRYHEVVDGDTCNLVCLIYGVTFAVLQKFNTYLNTDCTNLWLKSSVCVGEVVYSQPVSTDVALWFHTPTIINPLLSMNVDRCIALHNEILRHGWVSSGRRLESLDSTCKTWFDTFGDTAEAIRPQLSPDLVRFLEHARVIQDPETGADLCFFYWFKNLAGPKSMFKQAEGWLDYGRYGQLLVLYSMNNFTGHWCGLVYDQEAHLCIVCPSIHDADEIFEQKIWYPLETALEFWLGQVRKGRIATPHEGENEDLVNERYDPWQFIPYNDTMLEENVDAFNRLVEAIEARMPSAYRPAEAEGIVHGLVDESALQSIDLPPRFAYKFLCRARRPRFQMIAPGLEILTSSTFSDQPFRSYFSSSEPEFPPILLFRSGSNYKDDTTPHFVTGEPMPSLFTGFSRITCFPAGLYLLPTGEVRAEDECMLILPFGIGSNGYARKSDGSRFGRSRTGGNSHVDLYRPGYQPFEEQHEQSLVDVLKNWKGMVERGDWQIDENGVAGGMDVWREADSEEKWEAYVIPRAVEGVER